MSTDIVERLRTRATANKIVDLLDDRANDLLAKETGVFVMAADEIERLCAEIEALRSLLAEVRSHFTRDDDLPDELLPRIDAAMAKEKP